MKYEKIQGAIEDAELIVYHGDKVVRKLAQLCVRRLQSASVDDRTLCRLKQELARFNSQTGKWKGDPR